ncbi:hypothetical protein Tco_0660317, partial [Tanacetum coccineum]
MVLLDNQVSSPKSVLDDKALEDLSSDSNFNADLHLNDEEDNAKNTFEDINLPLKDQDPAFLFDKRRRRKAKALMLIESGKASNTEAKSNSAHGSGKA